MLTALTQNPPFTFVTLVPHTKDLPGCGLAARRGHRRPVAPPSVRPITGAAHCLEHLLIFVATGMIKAFDDQTREGIFCI